MKKPLFILIALYFLMSTAIAGTDIIYVSKLQPSFRIDLPANATTGYSWVLGKHDPFIQLVAYTYYPRNHKQLLGAPGHAVFQFKVAAKAFNLTRRAMVLEMLYERPWNHEIGSRRFFSVQIK